jgi:hypothetical protein
LTITSSLGLPTLHRLFENKKAVQIYDYVDIHVRTLEKMYRKRLAGYASIGYRARAENMGDDPADIIFDNTNFFPVYQNDMMNAARAMVIVSPFITRRRALQMLPHMEAALAKQVSVSHRLWRGCLTSHEKTPGSAGGLDEFVFQFKFWQLHFSLYLIPGEDLFVVNGFHFAFVFQFFIGEHLEELGGFFMHAFVFPSQIEDVGFFFFLHGKRECLLVGQLIMKLDVDHVIADAQILNLFQFDFGQGGRIQILEEIAMLCFLSNHFQEEFLYTLVLGPVGTLLIETHGLLFFFDSEVDNGVDRPARNGSHGSLQL